MRGSSVVRDDGTLGKVISGGEGEEILVEFRDGSRLLVSANALVRRADGAYSISNLPDKGLEGTREIVIPVVAEELSIETQQVQKAKVHVHKRVETREEVIDTPVTHEDVVIEHIPINRYIEDAAPVTRDEDGVLVIPVVEEVLVVEKRLFLREEVRVIKRRTTTNTPQTVVLRREVVDIEREEAEH